MRECTIIVPCRDNHGNPTDKAIRPILDDVLNQFGGYTLGDYSQGTWKANDGRVYRDTVRQLTIAIKSVDGIDAIRDLAVRFAVTTKQSCVHVILESGNIEWITQEGENIAPEFVRDDGEMVEASF